MKVEGIDHVHVEVADRDAAAEWYGRVFGLQRDNRLAVWAKDPMGPLILSTVDGVKTLSLFARESKPVSRDTTVAFRMSGKDFLEFVERISELKLSNADGNRVTSEDVIDHELSWSVYFLDPDENRFEVTTYDYDMVSSRL